MAFLAALPEIAEAGEAAGAAGEAGGAAEGGIFKKPGGSPPQATQQPGRQNQGDSRTGAFQQAFTNVRSALRGGAD